MLTIPAQARNNLTIPAPGKLSRFIIYIFQKNFRKFSFNIIFLSKWHVFAENYWLHLKVYIKFEDFEPLEWWKYINQDSDLSGTKCGQNSPPPFLPLPYLTFVILLFCFCSFQIFWQNFGLFRTLEILYSQYVSNCGR